MNNNSINTTDFYLDDKNVIDRLVKEWREHGNLIISYDFDNTVYDYHNEGVTFDNVINLLRLCKKIGAYFIVFTSCGEEKYPIIKEYLNKNNIPFDKINEDMDFIDFNGRKIYYNILLDDRAGLSSAYRCLLEAVNQIKNK